MAAREETTSENEDHETKHQRRQYKKTWLENKSPDYREKQRLLNAERKRLLRQNPEYREKERERQRQARQLRRQDEEYRSKERKRNTLARKIRRQDPLFRENEKMRERLLKGSKRLEAALWAKIVEDFKSQISQGHVRLCSRCGCFWYINAENPLTREDLMNRKLPSELIDACLCDSNLPKHLCSECEASVETLEHDSLEIEYKPNIIEIEFKPTTEELHSYKEEYRRVIEPNSSCEVENVSLLENSTAFLESERKVDECNASGSNHNTRVEEFTTIEIECKIEEFNDNVCCTD